jgi:hypothetical protein
MFVIRIRVKLVGAMNRLEAGQPQELAARSQGRLERPSHRHELSPGWMVNLDIQLGKSETAFKVPTLLKGETDRGGCVTAVARSVATLQRRIECSQP